MESKREFVMLLGASIMQLPALKAIEALGYASLIVDAREDAPLMALADRRVMIDLKDIEGLTQFLDEFITECKLVAIFTVGTDFSYVVSTLSERYHLHAHSKSAAMAATDKLKMRTLLQQQGVNVPAFCEISKSISEPQLEVLLRNAGLSEPWDVVVKPADSMGARGVVRCHTIKEILLASDQARGYSRSGKVIVEAYLDGFELSIDSLVADGHIYIHGIADRHIFYPPYFIEMGHTLPSKITQEQEHAVIKEFTKAVFALGLSHGAAKGDIKVTKDGVYIGEIAGRLSGGYMSGWSYPLASGINVTQLALRLALGQSIVPIEESSVDAGKFCAERAFISIPGVVEEILYLEESREMAGVQEIFVRIKSGENVTFPKNNVEKAGNILAIADSYEEAIARAENARKRVFIRLRADHVSTREFLFGQGESHISSAFIYGKDFNGNTREEILLRYEEITGHKVENYHGDRVLEFERAIEKGGLQGAVWYYDTFWGFLD